MLFGFPIQRNCRVFGGGFATAFKIPHLILGRALVDAIVDGLLDSGRDGDMLLVLGEVDVGLGCKKAPGLAEVDGRKGSAG